MKRWNIPTIAALTTALALGGCTWVDSQITDLTGPSTPAPVVAETTASQPETTADPVIVSSGGDECIVLATAVDAIASDWRTNPKDSTLRIDTYAVAANRIDGGYLSHMSGLLPPKSVPSVDVDNCGTILASSSDRVDFVWPRHGVPTGDRKDCWRNDGGWLSRPGIDVERTHAVLLYADASCGGSTWLVRLTKDYRGIWIADAPDPLFRAAWNPGLRR